MKITTFALSALFAVSVLAQDDDTTDTTTGAEPSQSCLYCRRMDKNAGFLVSYSFCDSNDTCLKDAWNYINRDCETGWTNGKDIELA